MKELFVVCRYRRSFKVLYIHRKDPLHISTYSVKAGVAKPFLLVEFGSSPFDYVQTMSMTSCHSLKTTNIASDTCSFELETLRYWQRVAKSELLVRFYWNHTNSWYWQVPCACYRALYSITDAQGHCFKLVFSMPKLVGSLAIGDSRSNLHVICSIMPRLPRCFSNTALASLSLCRAVAGFITGKLVM